LCTPDLGAESSCHTQLHLATTPLFMALLSHCYERRNNANKIKYSVDFAAGAVP